MKRRPNAVPRHNGEPVVVPVSAEDAAAVTRPYDRCRAIETELGGILLSILRDPKVRALEAEHARAWDTFRKALDAAQHKCGVAGKGMVFDVERRQFRRPPPQPGEPPSPAKDATP